MSREVFLLLTVIAVLASGQLLARRSFQPYSPFGGGSAFGAFGLQPFGVGSLRSFASPYAYYGGDIASTQLSGARPGGFPAALPGPFEVPNTPPAFPIPYIYSSKYLTDAKPIPVKSRKTIVPFFEAIGLSIASIIENILENLFDTHTVYPYPVANPVPFPVSIKIPVSDAVDRPIPSSSVFQSIPYNEVDHPHISHTNKHSFEFPMHRFRK